MLRAATGPADLGVGVGGGGGTGGVGKSVRVETGLAGGGQIVTHGFQAVGIMAQSVGGGGGNAGDTFGGAGGYGNNVTVSATVNIGGGGGDGNFAGDVHVTNAMSISTDGDSSSAIVAQSVGGGGGSGGTSTGGTANVGGGSGVNVAANFAMGGGGGTGSYGNTVDVINSGTLITTGAFSSGIIAQSIGGGGGIGGSSTAKSYNIGGSSQTSVNVNMGLAGHGGGASRSQKGDRQQFWPDQHAGLRLVRHHGDVGRRRRWRVRRGFSFRREPSAVAAGDTRQDDGCDRRGAALGLPAARPVMAAKCRSPTATGSSPTAASPTASAPVRSAVAAVSAVRRRPVPRPNTRSAARIGGVGGSAGSGQLVEVTNLSTGLIWTKQENSIGIFAQSIGGGGGAGGAGKSTGSDGGTVDVKFSMGGLGAGGGDGGEVHVTNSGIVLTDMANSHGIMAQSIGGSGGVGGAAGFDVRRRLGFHFGGSWRPRRRRRHRQVRPCHQQ